jgi:hypothetical protein
MNGLKLWLVVCAIIVASTAAFSVGQKPYPAVSEIKDGVETITNPDFPRDGRFTAKLTEEMSCGGEGGPEAGLLNRPLELDVDAQGNVYVMDMGDVNIKVYDSQGRFLRTIGRQGQGPGEFGGLAFFRLLSDGRLCALDTMQHRIIILAADGRYLSGFSLEGYFRAMSVDGQDKLYLAKWGAVKEPDQLSTEFQEVPYVTSIFRTDIAGKDLVHLTDFLGESMVMKGMGGGGVMSMGGLFTIVWAVSGAGKLYGAYNGDYSLGAFGPDGIRGLAFGRAYTPVKNKRYRGMVGQKKTMPPFSAIAIDEDENLWIELIRADDAKGFLYDVFSGDGIYGKQVAIEQRINRFKNGKIYSILRPEEGYPSIKRYKLELVPRG